MQVLLHRGRCHSHPYPRFNRGSLSWGLLLSRRVSPADALPARHVHGGVSRHAVRALSSRLVLRFRLSSFVSIRLVANDDSNSNNNNKKKTRLKLACLLFCVPIFSMTLISREQSMSVTIIHAFSPFLVKCTYFPFTHKLTRCLIFNGIVYWYHPICYQSV